MIPSGEQKNQESAVMVINPGRDGFARDISVMTSLATIGFPKELQGIGKWMKMRVHSGFYRDNHGIILGY